MRSLQGARTGAIRRRYARASLPPSASAVASTDRWTPTAVPSSSGCANGASGWTNSSPRSASGSVLKNGDAATSACTAEQTSCTNPGSVSGAERMPPPIVGSASNTRTESPSRASAIAAARPFGPDPTTMASITVGRAAGSPVDGKLLNPVEAGLHEAERLRIDEARVHANLVAVHLPLEDEPRGIGLLVGEDRVPALV